MGWKRAQFDRQFKWRWVGLVGWRLQAGGRARGEVSGVRRAGRKWADVLE